MRIGVAATPDVAIPTLQWLEDSEHTLVFVITQPDRPAGRGKELQQSPVGIWTQTHSIFTYKPENPNEVREQLRGIDLLITIGYGVLLAQDLLDCPTFGCINLHFSLLPHYRGAAPVQRSIESGESVSGVTVFKLDKGMDTGPIYSRIEIEIDPDWRSAEMLDHLARVGVGAVQAAIADIEKGIAPTAQSGTATLAKKIHKSDAQIRWSLASHVIHNRIRAFYPQPGAWTVFRGQSLKISRSSLHSCGNSLRPGELCVLDNKCFIGTGDGSLELITVIPSGKKEMSAIEWSRGARFTEGESCG